MMQTVLGRGAIAAVVGLAALAGMLALAGRADGAITWRQTTAIGTQEAYLAGVKLTANGGARFGAPAAVQRRLGPTWRCSDTREGVMLFIRNRTLLLGLRSLSIDPPCAPAQTAVGFLELRGRGQRVDRPRLVQHRPALGDR